MKILNFQGIFSVQFVSCLSSSQFVSGKFEQDSQSVGLALSAKAGLLTFGPLQRLVFMSSSPILYYEDPYFGNA